MQYSCGFLDVLLFLLPTGSLIGEKKAETMPTRASLLPARRVSAVVVSNQFGTIQHDAWSNLEAHKVRVFIATIAARTEWR